MQTDQSESTAEVNDDEENSTYYCETALESLIIQFSSFTINKLVILDINMISM